MLNHQVQIPDMPLYSSMRYALSFFALFSLQNAEGELQKALSRDSSDCSKEQDGKRHKTDQNNISNLRSKETGKQVKEDSDGGEPPKDNYVHIRAKRGQATNSHSLAERVNPKDNCVIQSKLIIFLDILNESPMSFLVDR